MSIDVAFRIVLLAPPAGVDFGIQHGKGSEYTTILKQRSAGGDLQFDFEMTMKSVANNDSPNFVGPIAQGPADARFVYVDIGTLAGQKDCCWERRIKAPLAGITRAMIEDVLSDKTKTLVARLPGTGKDGGPSCATVRPIGGWKVERR